MKFSFVIPVFKTERYLARCLDSLVAQTDGDFEAIVVDDGSPGGTASEIVARYDKRFQCIRQDKNRSTFQAKATGAQAATGDYIVPLDSDDYVLPRLVEELKREINSAVQPSASNLPPDIIVYQMAKEYRGKTYPVKYNHPKARCSGAAALEKLFDGRIFMPICGKAIRREVFLRAYKGLAVGPDFYLNFTDDLCWLIPILLNTKTVSFIEYPGYRYWRHDDSMTKDVMAEERIRRLAEQSRRSVETVIAYVRRLGAAASVPLGCGKMPHLRRGGILPPLSEKNISKDEANDRLISRIREQLYPTIRWLMRDMGQSRAALESAYGADLVAETLAWDAASGGKFAKLLRHCRTYGLAATFREVIAQLRGEEI